MNNIFDDHTRLASYQLKLVLLHLWHVRRLPRFYPYPLTDFCLDIPCHNNITSCINTKAGHAIFLVCKSQMRKFLGSFRNCTSYSRYSRFRWFTNVDQCGTELKSVVLDSKSLEGEVPGPTASRIGFSSE